VLQNLGNLRVERGLVMQIAVAFQSDGRIASGLLLGLIVTQDCGRNVARRARHQLQCIDTAARAGALGVHYTVEVEAGALPSGPNDRSREIHRTLVGQLRSMAIRNR
jgi:hypothetical protein